MDTGVQSLTRDEAFELAYVVANEIDSAIRQDRGDAKMPREYLTVTSPSLAGHDSRELDKLTRDFDTQVTFLKATDLMLKYSVRLIVSGCIYTGDVDLELRGTGIEG